MKKILNLQAKSAANALDRVSSLHCKLVKQNLLGDIYTVNNILAGYTKCRELSIAHKLFVEMPHRDTVSWNTMIAGYVNSGIPENSWGMFISMRRAGFQVDGYTFGSMLKGVASCARAELGKLLHSMIVRMGYAGNVYSGSALVDMYAKCGRVEDAVVVFRDMPERNIVSWNALIAGFVEIGDRRSAFRLFDCMQNEGIRPDDGTLAPLITMIDNSEFYKLIMQVHGKVIKHGLERDNTVLNATITSYSECGFLQNAIRVFDDAIGSRDLVTWNSMLAAYLDHCKIDLAFSLFIDMQVLGFELDMYTYTSVISACFEESHRNYGRSFHALVIKRGLELSVPICNALISMYLKSSNNSMKEAVSIFELMESKDRVSWNSILTGFSQYGLGEDTLKFFAHMRSEFVELDQYAFSAVLRSCSDLATLQLGQEVHVLVIKLGLEINEYVAGSLIFMYSKCGIIEDAKKAFEETTRNSAVSWNSIIFGYAQHGMGHIALDLFHLMKEKKVKLDHITFVAVLTACSHIGLVEEGLTFLNTMEPEYGIPPRMEHYACAVDLFGRAGRLDEAKSLIDTMPFEPDAMVLKTLLAACRICGNIELATETARRLLELEPEEHCTYVLLSDMYGHLKRWDEIASVKRFMREMGVKKVPGLSWIELGNQVHAFNAEDRTHPYCNEIYESLGILIDEIRWLESVSNSKVLAHNLAYFVGNSACDTDALEAIAGV